MMARTFVTLASLELASALQAHVAPRTPAPHMMAKSKVAPMFDAPAQLKGYVGEEDGFDPLGFSTVYDMKWLREAEIKHGRICMIAFVGFIFPDAIMRLPGHTESSFAAHDLNLGFAGGAMGQVARPSARVRALPCHSAAPHSNRAPAHAASDHHVHLPARDPHGHPCHQPHDERRRPRARRLLFRPARVPGRCDARGKRRARSR